MSEAAGVAAEGMALGLADVVLVVAFIVTLYIAKQIFSKPLSQPSVPAAAREDQKGKPPTKKKEEKPPAEKTLPMTICFGSQSGTADAFSYELAEEAAGYGFKANVVDLEEYDPDDLAEEKLVVLLMATFGEGEPTDNAVSFYEHMVEEGQFEEDSFDGVKFAVFALGNRQYEYFCNVGRNVDKVMDKHGGKRICEHGEGDDDGSMEDDWGEWKEKFWTAVQAQYGLSGGGSKKAFEPSWNLTYVGGDGVEKTKAEENYTSGAGFLRDPKYAAEFVEVKENREIQQAVVTEDDAKEGELPSSTRHIELNITGAKRIRWQTADNLGVFPRNEHRAACLLAKRLGVHPNNLIKLKRTRPGKAIPIPSPCSVLDALMWYCDIMSTPRLKVVTILAQYAESAPEKAKLLSFATPEGKEGYNNERRSLLELLDEFPSINMPFGDFLEIVPRLQPRYYTISSSSKADKNTIGVTVKLLAESKPNARMYKGLCTHFLSSLRPGKDKLCVFVRPSAFRLPRKISSCPIVMFGPGAGIAPFRAFLQEFQALKDKGTEVAETVLFFGCRNENGDFLYKDELLKAKEDGVLNQLHTAFSRDQKEKMYVQNRLAENSEYIWDLVANKKAYIYVCGGTSMGRSIRESFVSMAQEHGGMTEEAATEYVKRMQKIARYVQELWS